MAKDSDRVSKGVGYGCGCVSTCVQDIIFLVSRIGPFVFVFTEIVPLLILVILLIWK